MDRKYDDIRSRSTAMAMGSPHLGHRGVKNSDIYRYPSGA